MCESCQKLVDSYKEAIDAIDGSRDLIAAFMRVMTKRLDNKLVDKFAEDIPDTERDHDLFKVVVLNFLAGFLVLDSDPPDGYTNVVNHFYTLGVKLGSAYVCIRQTDNH